MYRSHTCNEIGSESVGKEVKLAGWVYRRRDHGGLIFIDLRDHYGITQVVSDPSENAELHAEFEKLRSEWVIQVKGVVRNRPEGMKNKDLDTGSVEVLATEMTILNESLTPPFEIDTTDPINEEIRMKYRYMDLRTARMQENIKFRSAFIRFIRERMEEAGFIDIQTPILANSSPEGARDFLVPSRIHPGKFYALPQAPQQFKQLLMCSGFDKYYQIAPSFRDEDPRADRSPGEFYQLDVEMAFAEQEDVFAMFEPFFEEMAKFGGKKLQDRPFPRIPYREAIDKYGSDKPDLRFGVEMIDLADIAKGCGFSVFSEADTVKMIVAPKLFTRGEVDKLTKVAEEQGAKGLAYILMEEEGPKSPILKFFSEDEIQQIVELSGAKTGDTIMFGAGEYSTVTSSLGAVRLAVRDQLELADPQVLAFAWIVDFPMYEINDEGKLDFCHNPFSMPIGGKEALDTKDPLDILAYQYDIVCNGLELSSGAVRNHEPETMYRAFEIVGYSREVVDRDFGHMVAAFKYGAPPHAGFAPGIDRMIMLLRDEPSIRDIIPFPKDGSARDPMLGAPGVVRDDQLDELHIKVVEEE